MRHARALADVQRVGFLAMQLRFVHVADCDQLHTEPFAFQLLVYPDMSAPHAPGSDDCGS